MRKYVAFNLKRGPPTKWQSQFCSFSNFFSILFFFGINDFILLNAKYFERNQRLWVAQKTRLTGWKFQTLPAFISNSTSLDLLLIDGMKPFSMRIMVSFKFLYHWLIIFNVTIDWKCTDPDMHDTTSAFPKRHDQHPIPARRGSV